eukprot:CAMPEP_0181191392 /NCGR_PEP_ID=MMETSP1096-20121128/12711_1 /TAXON_ID=156174 ORGANISM="Chrysochromulina ericina, Strain CCMP281" /NCGR_SAMPLE_ID=MMETSP1096 /ASSEMBLY_ACC=CAM_ASM_000453 /LENGTH=205 /DNA_ID=CAMNT_0023280689 /DNA_START=226 /DNA_END=843 /DNA_ORIENTATION=-
MELEPHQRDGHTKVLHQLLVNIASELLAAQSEVHRSNGARCVSFPGRAVDDHLVISTSIPRNLLRDHVSRVLGAPWTVPARILVLFLAPFLPPRATRYAVLLSNPRWGLITPAIHSSRINRPRAKDAVVLRGDNEASCPSLSLKDGPVLCVDQRCTQSITERLLGRLDHPWGVALFTKVIPLMQQHTRLLQPARAVEGVALALVN